MKHHTQQTIENASNGAIVHIIAQSGYDMSFVKMDSDKFWYNMTDGKTCCKAEGQGFIEPWTLQDLMTLISMDRTATFYVCAGGY